MLDVRDANLIDLRGRQGVGGEDRRLVRPLDDVNLLAAKLSDDGLHARAFHADARADRVNVALGRSDGDLRALARLAHGALDDDRAVVNLRHFHLEEALLGRLRRDATHVFDGQGQLQLVANVDLFARKLARLVERKLATGIGDLLDDDLRGEDFQTRLRRPLDLNLLARLELLAGGGAHGLLHGLDDDLAVYALLFADRVNALPDGCAHNF